MKRQKFLACLMAGAMVLSMAACGDKPAENTPTDTSTTPSTEESTPAPDVTAPTDEAASIDFEDGNMAFVAPYTQPADAADVELSIVDFNGSKALQVKNLTGKVPYIAFDATALLGADVAKVATVEMTVGTSYDNGGFSAVSGKLIAWSGEDLTETTDDWSVYMASKNPAKVVATLAAGEEFIADAGNLLMISLQTDNGVTEGNGNATLYIDNIRFLDASGNLLTADTSVAFVGPEKFAGSGLDVSNLMTVNGAVNFEGFAISGDGWAQAGFTMPQEILDALVPGSVVEISYTSETGNMWIVMNEAAVGWSRVADGGNSSCYGGKCFVTYEQIAAVCGDDISTWGSTMQFESDSAWEVFAVRVGTANVMKPVNHLVNFEGFATSGDGWAQAGVEMPQEILDALVPGAVVNIAYTSESGDMWIVMNGAAVGWSRVADGGQSVRLNGVCQVTYEQIAAICGDDVSTWGAEMQCESDTAWEVFSVSVGQSPVE